MRCKDSTCKRTHVQHPACLMGRAGEISNKFPWPISKIIHSDFQNFRVGPPPAVFFLYCCLLAFCEELSDCCWVLLDILTATSWLCVLAAFTRGTPPGDEAVAAAI